MRKTLCAILTGLSLVPSIAISKPPEPKINPLVKRVVELLKIDPATTRNSQQTRAVNFSRCSGYGNGGAACPAEFGTLTTYRQQFQEGDKIISLNYSDCDDNFQGQERQYFQSDGIIGQVDSLTILVSYGKSRGYVFYQFKDGGLDGKIDSCSGDVLELGVRSDEAKDYYFKKEEEINQRYQNHLKEMEQKLLAGRKK